MPVHWGTFNLALHDWDAPAETLLERAADHSGRLIMPKLGAPTEPSRVEHVEPWWREISVRELAPTELEVLAQRNPQPPLSSSGG